MNRKLHIEGGIWHCGDQGGLLNLCAPDGKWYRPTLQLVYAYEKHRYSNRNMTPMRVKRFIRGCILKTEPTKYGLGAYVRRADQPNRGNGKVTLANSEWPRFVVVRWGDSIGNWSWEDSHSLSPGFPSSLHEIADCAE